MTPDVKLPSCWQASAAAGDEVTRKIGDLTIRHQRPGTLLRLALTLTNTAGNWSAYDMKRTSAPMWRRWPAPADAVVESRPALADAPMVLRLRYPLTVGPDHSARCLAAIPLWCQLRAVAGDQSFDLVDVPTRVMSHAWWGSPQDGTMCYSLPGFDLLSPNLERADTTAFCRIVVSGGDNKGPVTVNLLRLPVQELTLYRADNGWWTSELHVDLRADGDQVDEVKAGPPDEAKNPIEVAAARISPGDEGVRRFVRDPLAFLSR